ncbi:hypothetical protein SLA2020_112150 [Shorea laevis]
MDLKRLHNPSMMLILETKISGEDAKDRAASLGFPKYCIVDSDGLAGGLWLLWDDSIVAVEVVSQTPQAIHAVIQVRNNPLFPFNWFFSGIYGRPQFEIRCSLWQELMSMADVVEIPWTIMGDFNDIIDQSEKFRGNAISQTRVKAYIDCMNTCNMVDLGFTGNKFTWVNCRFFGQLIRERLDRAWANPDWKILFPEAVVFHLPRTHSDHCPILLDVNPVLPRSGSRPFRMEKFWVDHPDFKDLIQSIWLVGNDSTSVCLEKTKLQAKAWSAATFGNIFKEKNKILARLGGIQKSPAYNVSSFLWNLEKELLQEYENILKLECDLWFMKSRTNWLVEGDRNTKFFHCSTVQYRSNNRIYGLKDQRGNWVYDGHSLVTIIVDYFNDLFASSHSHSFSDSFANIGCETPHSFDLSTISGVPSEKEIHDATNSMQPYKALGPDGIHPFFYQKMWSIVKDTLCTDIKEIFATGIIPPKWCECLIVLIPKVKAPDSIHQFRPIGLCNTVLKIISKILVNRIKPWMDKIISPCQASFISGRQGTDNVLILQEFVYFFRKKTGTSGDMICKLDLEKAYDRLEWSFIHETLVFFKFPSDIIRLIMSSITSSSLSILVNGERTDSFFPSRGIRQGDPLSPYIFIMCMEHLSIKLTSDMDNGIWKGCKAGRRGPFFSHLFFADDIIIMGKATVANSIHLKNILDFFCLRSGQSVNRQKSSILFSKNVDQASREAICSTLGYNPTDDLGKYLGIPISAQKLNKSKWQFVVDKVRGKLTSWKSKFLSFAGHTTLANFVLASIPNYYMQSSFLPASIHMELDRTYRNFIWGAEPEQRKIHLVNWDKVTKGKKYGGLGLKSSKESNIIAMSKLNWRLHKDKDKRWSELYRMKYNISYPRRAPTHSGSPSWKAIGRGYELFINNIKWIPRTGRNISFWNDCWVSSSPLSATIFGPHKANFASSTVKEYFQAAEEAPNLINYDLPSDILASIQATPISWSSTRDDGFAWKNSPNGEFSAALAYQSLKDPTMSDNINWKWIWKAPTLPKIQYFIWLLTHRRLKCFDFLNKLGICASASCPRCHAEDETVEHLIKKCPISSQILGSLLPDISTTQQQQLEFVEWLHFNIQCSEKSNILNIPWNVVFCFAIWGIWLHRNQLIHSTHTYPICSASKLIVERAAEYYSTVLVKRQNQCPTCMYRWIKPPLPFLKLNTDGSAINNPGKVAGGGLIRDSWGNWILGFSRRIGWSSILVAELWAIRDGLQLAVSRNFSHLLIETDSLSAVNLLSNDSIDNHPLSSLVFDCRDLLRCIPHVKISHVMRESNMAADILAKMGHDLSEDFVVFYSIPQPVVNACIADIVGVEFPRT